MTPDGEGRAGERHLWEHQPVRDVLLILAGLALVWAVWWLRAMLAPVLLGLTLAYAIDPLTRRASRLVGGSRAVCASLFLLVGVLVLAGLAVVLAPVAAEQVAHLADRLPEYAKSLIDRVAQPLSLSEEEVESLRDSAQARPAQLYSGAMSTAARLFGAAGTVLGNAAYLLAATLLTALFFVFFSTRLGELPKLLRYVPASVRDDVRARAGDFDRILSGFIRGQLIVAIFTTIGFLIGFWLIGAPYWFFAALIGGGLSVIPYGQAVGWILAIGFMLLDQMNGGETTVMWALLGPSLVYAVTQSIETWVVTPIVQGEAVNLHPVVVILVVMVGGYAAGVLGVLLAVPLAAFVKVLRDEHLSPELQEWADAN